MNPIPTMVAACLAASTAMSFAPQAAMLFDGHSGRGKRAVLRAALPAAAFALAVAAVSLLPKPSSRSTARRSRSPPRRSRAPASRPGQSAGRTSR